MKSLTAFSEYILTVQNRINGHFGIARSKTNRLINNNQTVLYRAYLQHVAPDKIARMLFDKYSYPVPIQAAEDCGCNSVTENPISNNTLLIIGTVVVTSLLTYLFVKESQSTKEISINPPTAPQGFELTSDSVIQPIGPLGVEVLNV